MNKVIQLQRRTLVTTTEGTAPAWQTYDADVRASVEPASPTRIEQLVGGTAAHVPISHLVTIWHRASRQKAEDDPGSQKLIHTADRALFQGRALHIVGMQNPREDNRALILACEERDQ